MFKFERQILAAIDNRWLRLLVAICMIVTYPFILIGAVIWALVDPV